uniref:Tribbles homolog 2 n=10 Tax=Aves TaxID=8782 RepID=A0A8D2MY68_ZONAL
EKARPAHEIPHQPPRPAAQRTLLLGQLKPLPSLLLLFYLILKLVPPSRPQPQGQSPERLDLSELCQRGSRGQHPTAAQRCSHWWTHRDTPAQPRGPEPAGGPPPSARQGCGRASHLVYPERGGAGGLRGGPGRGGRGGARRGRAGPGRAAAAGQSGCALGTVRACGGRQRARRQPASPPPRYGRPRNKTQDFEELSSIRSIEPSQSFSPNLGSPSPPETPNLSHCVSCIGKYLLLEPLEGDHVFRAVHLHSGEELVCKVFDIGCYQELLAPCFCLPAHKNINQITEIILGETKAYVFFERSYGDMHSFVRTCKKLKEEEAAKLFYQIASAVAHCHDGGLVLRDLKLRKFIFKDEERTRVKLESLEDAYILRGNDDSLSDKHGCPAYVSPEILNTNGSYSGKAADVWSLGVMLYTMLVGRYPFHDIEPSSLFSKIRRGQFNIPETLSPKAKCLIRSILRREPSERLTSQEILDHPWFSTDFNVSNSGYGAKEVSDQLVPDVNMEEDLDPFFN